MNHPLYSERYCKKYSDNFLGRSASLIVVTAAIALGLSACLPPPVAPERTDSAALGVKMEKRWAGFGGSVSPARVYFIRWNGGNDPASQREIIQSNFSRGDRVYLLNAKPGRYSAVAASDFSSVKRLRRRAAERIGQTAALPSMFRGGAPAGRAGSGIAVFHAARRTPSPLASAITPGNPGNLGLVPGPSGGSPISGVLLVQTDVGGESEGDHLDDYQVYTTYFSERLVRKTQVEVRSGGFAVMGEWVVEMENAIEGADRVQDHFYRLIHPFMDDPVGTPIVDPDNAFSSRARLAKEDRGKEAEVQFLRQALKDLAETPWTAIVQKRLDALR